jgi:hypothetical protein
MRFACGMGKAVFLLTTTKSLTQIGSVHNKANRSSISSNRYTKR